MPSYHYSCTACGRTTSSTTRDDNLGLCICGKALMQRRWHVNAQPTFQPHYNWAVGSYVTSNADFNEKLHVAGEKAGSVYTRVDPGDMPRPTADDHIFDTQMKHLTDNGFVNDSGKVTLDDSGNFQAQ